MEQPAKLLCEEKEFYYEGNPENPFYTVGHNEIFSRPDGHFWLSCHDQQNDYSIPFLVIDPLEFNEKGEIEKKEPSYKNQTINSKE